MFLFAVNLLYAQSVEYMYSNKGVKNTISETGLNVPAMYDCTFQMGKLFTNNASLVNAFGISSSGGVVFFQGLNKSQQGLFFVREGEIEFIPYGKKQSGEFRVFSSNDPVSMGIVRGKEGFYTVGTKPSFESGTMAYPNSPYDQSPVKIQADADTSRAFASGLDRCLDNFCQMYKQKKKEYEDRSGTGYVPAEEYSAMTTCRLVLKSMGQSSLVTKMESKIKDKDCLNLPVEPRNEVKDDLKKENPESSSESQRK